MSFSTILHKRNSSEGIVPSSSALSAGEIAINTADGKLFTKTTTNSVKTFLNSEQIPYLLNSFLSSIVFQYGNNSADGALAAVLGGIDNNVNGWGSTVVNGSDNDIDADYAFIGNGSNNTILTGGDFGAIVGGQNNTLNHPESFILGSNITSHLSGITYVNSLSSLGKIYGDGSELTGIVAGDSEATTLVRSSSANWTGVYTTVQSNSATNWNYQGTDLKGLSANWQSTYLTVSSLSAQWAAGEGSSSEYLPLTGGNLSGTLTVQGNVSASQYLYGDGTFITGLAVEGNTVSVSDPLKFKYTGNGSTKSFQVSGTSNSTNANLVRVHVDNVVQEPYTAYTLSFSAVEFVVAPANGQSIYIITPNVSIGGEPARRFDFVVGTPASFSYSGVAEANSLITQPVWTITRIAYTSVGEISATQYASNVTWSGRLTATYNS
jgi:hypothetical protein